MQAVIRAAVTIFGAVRRDRRRMDLGSDGEQVRRAARRRIEGRALREGVLPRTRGTRDPL
jgi:hypothetical protein